MKIGRYPVKPRFKPARIAADVISLGIAAMIFVLTVGFFPQYRAALSKAAEKDLYGILFKYGESLTYRHYFAWIFPALAVVVIAVYLILTLKSHRFRKYKVTKDNAQSVYDWYAFAVSLCKIPALMAIFEIMYVFQRKMMFETVNPFSYQIVLYFVIIAVIIRFSVHKIRRITEIKPKKVDDDSPIKVRIVDDDE
ncbi:MAG: hypothetical protein K2N06_08970 [Oscillospiraceae bacterium]|nr:hypothetical protein [Oscillospiraceae bacterium]